MTRVYVLVEGQSEEAFVNELLLPDCAGRRIYLVPIIVRTSAEQRGGITNYAKVKPQIVKLCRQDAAAYVTTMFDLYALPNNFPGMDSQILTGMAAGARKAKFLETELARDIGERNFIPNLLVHEFEALLFTQLNAFEQWTDDDGVLEPLRAIRRTTEPEDINQGQETAPSKRILAVMPGYQKTFHGPLIACDIGLAAIRADCPHFDAWLQRIEALV